MALGLIGLGIQSGGQILGARNRRHSANINYMIDMGNAQIEREDTLAGIAIQGIQNRLRASTAATQWELAQSDGVARTRNAERMQRFAETRTKEGRANIRRSLREFDAFRGSQVSATAASGVSFDGSVLDVLAESAGQMQRTIQDLTAEVSMEYDENINASMLERYSAISQMVGARAEYDSAMSENRIGEMSMTLAKINADRTYSARKFGALSNRNASRDQARGQMLGAAGSLFAGGAGIAKSRYEYNQVKV
jgi:hypothetical protein